MYIVFVTQYLISFLFPFLNKGECQFRRILVINVLCLNQCDKTIRRASVFIRRFIFMCCMQAFVTDCTCPGDLFPNEKKHYTNCRTQFLARSNVTMTSVIQYQARKATVASINAQSRSIGSTSAYSFPGFAKIVHKLDCHSVVPSVSEKMGRPIVSRENACFEGNNLAYVSLRALCNACFDQRRC